MVSYLGKPGLSKRGISLLGQPGFLSSSFTSSCVMQLAVSLSEKGVFEMDASGLKKLNVRHLHYIYPLWLGIYGHQSAETEKWHVASMLADTMFPPNLTASGLQETLFSWLP